MFPGSLCHTQTETDGNILYLALLLLLGGDVTQFSSVFFCFFFFYIHLGVFIADDHAGMRYSSTPASMAFHSIAKVIHWSWSKSCALHPHPISLIITHSYSSLCRWWCRKFIFCGLCTIICMCHLISLIQTNSHKFLHPNKITSTKHLVCFGSLVTTFLFPCSLHMPLITTFAFSMMGLG